MAMDSAEIDDTGINAAANICDEDVEIKPVTSPATYENRYEANGVLYTSASPDENIGKLISAMGGLIAYSGGKVVMYAAGYRIPTVTLTEKHFAGQMTVQTKTSARDRVNGVKGVYVSPENDWQPSDFPQITSATYVTKDAGIRYWRDVALPFTTSPSCAQRLAVIELRRAREEITMTARFRLEAMQVRAGDTVMITNSKMGWTQKVFEVMEWNFASDGSPPQLAIEMTLRETASSIYNWTVTDEIYVDDAPNTTLPNPFTLSAPTNLTLTADGTTQQIQADGTALPRILVSWSAPAEEFIQAGGNVGIEYKEITSTTYLTWNTVPGDQTTDYISSDVKIGLTYNVRIYGESFFKVSTSYISATVNVQKDTVAPSTPTGLTAAVGTGKAVSLDWDDNTEPDLSEYSIYRNTTGVTPGSIVTDKVAEVRASRFVDTQVDLGTTYYYWVNAADLLGNVSGFATRVSAVPTYVSGSSVDPSKPATPSAPTFSSEGTYISADGTAFARISVSLPAMPTGGIALNLMFRIPGAGEWMLVTQLDSGNRIVSVDGLVPGTTYDFSVQAISNFGIASDFSAQLQRTAPIDTQAPATPTGVSATVGTGRAVSLDWNDNTDADLSEYGVYRNTTAVTPASITTDKIAEVRASRFVDTDVAIGTTYYYWVNAFDYLENNSGFSTRVSAVPTYIEGVAVDQTAPGTPNAPTFSSEATYLSSDGTSLARVSLTAPAMPTLGKILTILYRRSGASDWIIGNQLNSGSVAVSIDDLTPGVAYEFAARAISNFDILSAISATLSRTAPNYSGTVTAPTGATLSTTGVKPRYIPGTTLFNFGTRVSWDSNTQSDFAYYEVKATGTDSDAAVNYTWGGDSPDLPYRTRDPYAFLYSQTLSSGYVRVRAVNRTGTASAWTSVGNANGTAVYGTGTISRYNDTDVTVTGIKTGGGSSTRQVLVRYEVSDVVTLTGGATTEVITIDITNRGFSAKPDAGWLQCANDTNISGAYDFDAAGNSSTVAYFNLQSIDGTNLPSGLHRFSIQLVDFS